MRAQTWRRVFFTLRYIPGVAQAAVTRAFWMDALVTRYIVTTPDWAGTLDLIQRGPDQSSPRFHALAPLVVGILGESERAFRLLDTVGYERFCVALRAWVS
ncbi:MAG: hypothetical protein CFK52_06785 [Chloracidobacterium sp. CP2_5A]|nr:MAG: hypothetical protein CFK52_06785 [Chloracidobacterium sp. CP2_5A]